MAEDLTTVTTFPHFARMTLSGTPNNLTRIDLPALGTKATILFEAESGKVTHTGTDAAAIGTEYFTVPANAAFEMVYGMGISASSASFSLYVGSGSASTVCCVCLEGRAQLEVR